jgi:hypothetical protein
VAAPRRQTGANLVAQQSETRRIPTARRHRYAQFTGPGTMPWRVSACHAQASWGDIALGGAASMFTTFLKRRGDKLGLRAPQRAVC